MKSIICFLLLLISATAADTPPISPTAPIVRAFATNYGPITLRFDGEKVTGRYRISVKPQPDEGTITGTFRDGLVDGAWREEKSGGRILLAFSRDFRAVNILYTSEGRSDHWNGEWTGLNETALATAPAEVRARLRNDWK